ncbi:fungal-specific transcription factor domain-containing protein [Apodospora peruviana]|uniref:Fungal-specific transcription factor domain-containing protein n=1 Tax=Apodospora peruviana TaxID=516989 RepID=A0AAE0M8I8_9PEZI|nr:fungal-specific transcription factor domain-containing protein [Apodospora peruviana]
MTRPKVPDDKRQRTAQACESCKRRKQKCNGLNPCHTCIRRKLTCSYTPTNASDHVAGELCGSPTKRRHIETSPTSFRATIDASQTSPAHNGSHESPRLWEETRDGQLTKEESPSVSPTAPPPMAGHKHVRRSSIHDFETQSGRTASIGQAEEATIYTETRMLQDQTGRLLYMGDASTLSILQLCRIIVESTAGADVGSPFIDDPKRHRIMEHIIDFPENAMVPCLLPDRETISILVESYFTNTCGLIEVFDKKSFIDSIDASLVDPPSASNYLLCHVYLVLALGLVLAAPIPGSREEEVIKRQHDAKLDRAELFFRSAKSMCNPVTGFEDADFWSVQALSLMSLYMLAVSKRNTAYAYLGMAIRSAYSLGLHREETMNDFIFTTEQMKIRRNLWKTLFILDRFLAASLGRPTAISEDDCTCKIIPDKDESIPCLADGETDIDVIHTMSLDACVRSCHVIGDTLAVFSKRKISTTGVQRIAGESKDLRQAAQTGLFSRLANKVPTGAAQCIATLHVHLLSLHSLILLTRQLFIMHNWKLQEQRTGLKKQYTIRESPMAKYSEACVIASYHTLRLVQRAREANYLPQRNPFIIYFLFAASLIVFMNQFASLYYTDAYAQTITDAIDTMRYCAETDPQADRLLEIMEKFYEVVERWTKDHKYQAPTLSSDLSGLYSQMANSRLPHEHPHTLPSISNHRDHDHLQAGNIPHRSSLNLPPLPHPLPPLSEMIVSQSPNSISILDTKMNGMSPQHMASPPIPYSIPPRTSVSAHSMSDGSESANGHIEFSFDGLWENWQQHHQVTVPPGAVTTAHVPPHVPPPGTPSLPTLGAQFSPTAPVTAPAFSPYPTHPEPPRVSPLTTMSANIPLYHTSSFG